MPELPEVETIRLGLQQYLVGHTIESVDVKLPKMLHGDVQNIIGTKVTGVRRFGKGLVIDLENGYSFAIHVKMTGQVIYQDPNGTAETNGTKVSKVKVGALPSRATHVIFHLDHNTKLYYNDFRQFGWIKIITSADLTKILFFKELGPEFIPSPDSGQARMTKDMFAKLLKSANTPIKPLLMNQTKIAGIGNIYANESVFDAQIDPRRSAKKLTDEEIDRLYDSILTFLKKGLHYGGTSEHHYVNALGQEGTYQKHFVVYGQQRKPCIRCGSRIQKITQAGRGTFFCSNCQK